MLNYRNIPLHRLPRDLQLTVIKALAGPEGLYPVTYIRRIDRARGIIHSVRNGTQCIRRAHPNPKDPKTPEQLLHRAYWAQAKRLWEEVSDEEMVRWGAYATAHRAALGMGTCYLPGYNLFVRTQTMRLRRGLASQLTAPRFPPPSTAHSVRPLPSEGPESFRFQVDHSVPDIAGMHLLAEITPATPRLTRKPRETDLRCICDAAEASFAPLQPTGFGYEFLAARFPIALGQRYGLRVRLISPDSIASCADTIWDFIKE
jgi:hypothetical protein